MLKLLFTQQADQELRQLEKLPDKRGLVKQIKKLPGYLQQNPRHPLLIGYSGAMVLTREK